MNFWNPSLYIEDSIWRLEFELLMPILSLAKHWVTVLYFHMTIPKNNKIAELNITQFPKYSDFKG